MSIDHATQQLKDLIATYQHLTEAEKFALGRQFNEATGGKLSPYNSPQPVAVTIVPVENEEGQVSFLGVRRAIPPCVGEVALPGGFLSPNEDPWLGAVRETLEETGIALDPGQCSPTNQAYMTHNNNLLMFFATTQTLTLEQVRRANARLSQDTDGEASELVLVTPDTPLCFPLHQQAVNNAFVDRGMIPQVEPAKVFKPRP